MSPQIKIYFLLLFSFIAVASTHGQSSIGLNTGYLQPLLMTTNDSPYTQGSKVAYSGSFFISTCYKEKTGSKFYLGLNLNFNNYKLNYYERQSIHQGLDEYIHDLNYNFNYLDLYFYPEFVFGKTVAFYINAGITGGILLNGSKSGLITNARMHEGPDGPYFEYTETEIEGNAKSDLKDFTAGVQLGTGIRYHIKSNWNINIDASSRFIPFPIQSDFAKSQLDLLISAGAEYSIRRKKASTNDK